MFYPSLNAEHQAWKQHGPFLSPAAHFRTTDLLGSEQTVSHYTTEAAVIQRCPFVNVLGKG